MVAWKQFLRIVFVVCLLGWQLTGVSLAREEEQNTQSLMLYAAGAESMDDKFGYIIKDTVVFKQSGIRRCRIKKGQWVTYSRNVGKKKATLYPENTVAVNAYCGRAKKRRGWIPQGNIVSLSHTEVRSLIKRTYPAVDRFGTLKGFFELLYPIPHTKVAPLGQKIRKAQYPKVRVLWKTKKADWYFLVTLEGQTQYQGWIPAGNIEILLTPEEIEAKRVAEERRKVEEARRVEYLNKGRLDRERRENARLAARRVELARIEGKKRVEKKHEEARLQKQRARQEGEQAAHRKKEQIKLKQEQTRNKKSWLVLIGFYLLISFFLLKSKMYRLKAEKTWVSVYAALKGMFGGATMPILLLSFSASGFVGGMLAIGLVDHVFYYTMIVLALPAGILLCLAVIGNFFTLYYLPGLFLTLYHVYEAYFMRDRLDHG